MQHTVLIWLGLAWLGLQDCVKVEQFQHNAVAGTQIFSNEISARQ